MSNGTEQDIRDLRKEVAEIAKKGCGHKDTHEKSIERAHERISEERREREKFEEVERTGRDKFKKEVNDEVKKLKDYLTIRIVAALVGTAALNFAGAYYLLGQFLAAVGK